MNEVQTFRRGGFFTALLWNPDRLEEVCQDYLHSAAVPNLAGLCAVIGATPQRLKSVFSETKDQEKIDPGALEVLAMALLQIESNIVENGLTGDYNPHMSKFVLSAFHNRNEKTESHNTSDNTIRVVLANPNPVSLEELREYDRLETAIEEQRQLELTALGRRPDEEASEAGYSEDCLI